MALGPHLPEWMALRLALRDVAISSGGDLACVLDASSHLWCTSDVIAPTDERWVAQTVRHAFHDLHPPLVHGDARGRRVSYAEREAYLRVFAGTHVLLVTIEGEVDELRLHRAVDAKLPEIERLTSALPPTDGPDTSVGAVAKA